MKTLEAKPDSQKIKLRTLTKDRSLHRYINPQSPHQTSEKQLPLIPLAINLNKRQNTLSRLKTINYNERSFQSQISDTTDILPEQNNSYSIKFINKLDQLDKKAEELIEKRLQKIIADQSDEAFRNTKMIDRRNDNLEPEFQNLIKQIKQLRDDELEKNSCDSKELQKFMDKKIRLLEKLLAEKSIEAEVLKNYYFSIGALSRKRKTKNRIASLLSKLQKIKNPQIPKNPKTQVYNESWNKNSFKAPKSSQYETYRYAAPKFTANPQPLPRSSYKSQYLNNGTDDQQLFCKNLDHNTFFGANRRGESSTYSRDYKSLKTQPINYKELDSYRDKIRNIQVSYIFKKNGDEALNNCNFRHQQSLERILYTRRPEKKIQKANSDILQKNNKSLLNPKILEPSTQARSQYRGQKNLMTSNIKNKQLTFLKYLYKNVVHS